MSVPPTGRPPWRVVELTDVCDRSIEEALNAAAGDGWRFEAVHFVTQPGNRRPMMAFLLFTRYALPEEA
ncbi:hypothetical protein [Candidatus Deferrimicrobium sp.]|uniref:hypothetical protein n=1 Tax=Candidatus Deferrimicrobium sp. TaxID=3060586 RepID=UPI002ED189FF